MMQEFKYFAMRGDVVDMAVGIVIGGSFGKIVSSFVGDIIMPPIGMVTGRMDFSNMAVELQAAATGWGREHCRCRNAELRVLHQRGHRLRHYRVRHFHGGQGDELREGTDGEGRGGEARGSA